MAVNRWESDAFPSREAGLQVGRDVLETLQYTFHPLFDWRPLPNQQLSTVRIDAHGLRNVDPPLRTGGLRCVLLGGSFAWGFGASSNETTPAALIASRLAEATGREVTAINLADQAYCSIQELKAFLFTVDELRPDLVVCITGVNDIGRGRVGAYKREPRYVASAEFLNWGIRIGLLGQFVLPRIPTWKKAAKVLLRDHRCPPYPGQPFFSFDDPPGEDIPLRLLSHKVDVVSAVCARLGTPVAFVLQPMLLFKKHRSASEEAYLEHVRERDHHAMEHYRRNMPRLREWFAGRQNDPNTLFIDSTTFFDRHPESTFFDGMHVSDHGYTVWTQTLCERLKSLL